MAEGSPQHMASSPDIDEHISIGRYIATRVTSLVPPMHPAPNPFKALTLLNRKQWLNFSVAFLGWSWDSFDFFTVSLTTSQLAATFDKSVTDITWGITLVLMLRSVGAITFGIASDRWGRKWPFIVNQLLFVVLELGTGFCQTYKQFLACRALFGIAMGGLYGNAAATALEDCPAEARGIVSGLLQQGYAFGYLLATAFARALVDTTPHGWRPLYWFAACPPVLIIIFRLFLGETETFRRRQEARSEMRGGIAGSFMSEGKVALQRHWLILIYLVLLMAGFNFMSHGSQDLYPTMLENQFNFSQNAVTVTQVVANLGALSGGTLCGWASQIFGRRFSIIAISIVGGALLYPYTFVQNKKVIAAAYFEQFMVQGAWGVIPIHLMELSPGPIRTFAVGTAYQLGNLVSSASSTIESTIGERFPLPPTEKSAHRYEYGKVICIFMGCVYAYVILITLAGPERLGRNFDVEHDADLQEVAAHRGIDMKTGYGDDAEKGSFARLNRPLRQEPRSRRVLDEVPAPPSPMHRRSSGSPIEDEDSSASRPDDGPNAIDEKSHSQIARRGTSFDLRRDGSATPRSRNSSMWRTPSSVLSPPSNDTKAMSLGSPRLPMEAPSPDGRRARQSRLRSPWSCSILTAFTTCIAVAVLISIVRSFTGRQIGGDGCGVPMMSPTFIRMLEFDTEHTRFASKYNLFVYREEGVDPYTQDNIGLNGVPVLFLPGNAGSYRQVRSLAAEASRHYYDVVRHDESRHAAGTRSLDFFMVDFNEDMAAFHGQTLLDQAEFVNEAISYILSLYHDPRRTRRDPGLPDPSAVVLVGHSMGGIVARTALTMANYQANSVNTIITMSAPHAKPPVSFDSDIVHTYKQINDYWRDAYAQTWANNNPLWHVTLISIAGGARDTVVPSDYASISSLVPETHGFTVFTSSIPDVWIGMDHLSITWCDQFRKAIIKSLFEIIDARRPTQTKPRAERMRVLKRWYLTGLESVAERTLPQKEANTLLTLEDNANTILAQGQRLVLRELGLQHGPDVRLLPIPPPGVSGKKFTLLTDQSLDKNGNVEVLFCSVFPLSNGRSTNFPLNLDFSGGTVGSTRLACKSAAEDSIHLPASTSSSQHPYDRTDPFSYLQYDLESLAEHQFVAVVDKANVPTAGFLVAEFSDSSDSFIRAKVGLGGLLSAGLKMRLPANRPMLTEVKIPALHSSLLDYRLKITRNSLKQELFAPLLRQSVSDPHETKFFVNVNEVNVNLHGVAPFMPPAISEQAALGGVSFQLWTDPTSGSTVDISLHVDLASSLGELVMRYRTIFAALPLLVVALVLRKQFQIYDETGYFIPFTDGLDRALRSSFPLLLVAMSLLASSLATSKALPQTDETLHWRTNSTETPIDFTKNDLLLGSQDAFFWFLVPVFGVISVGVCVLVNYLALFLVTIFSWVYGASQSKSGYIRREDRGSLPIFSTPTPRRRIIHTAILLVLVSTVIPYQFAYMVACIVQLATCVRAQWHVKETRSTSHLNFGNYAHSILILMLWILPINVLVLLVWAHNLVVHWFMPFSSHHNVLSIMPFLILVETMTSGAMIPRITNRLKHITSMIFFAIAIYSAIYGVSYAYLLHHLANFLAAWFVGIYLFGNNLSPRRLWRIIDGDELPSESGNSHVKKKP